VITAPEDHGWWIASDGLWYPPETHPDARAALPAPPSEDGSGSWDAVLASFEASTLEWRPPPVELRPAPTRTARRGRRGLIAAVVGAAVVLAVTLAAVPRHAGPAAPGASESGWVNHSLHVVGTPVVGDGSVVLLGLSASHDLELDAVDPANGSVTWTHPYSPSGITPGVQFGPVIVQNVALDLDPVGNAKDPGVDLKGIDVRTGKVVWSLPQPVEATDAPEACNNDHDFCLPVWDTQTTSAVVAIDASDGQPVFVVQGPYRNVSASAPGNTDRGGVWETSDAAPTFTWVDANGQRTWTRSVADLFGGSQYAPDDGYYFALQGSVNVGSVGLAPTGNTTPVGEFKTVGIRAADGSIVWSAPGDFLCGGTLAFLSTDLVCQYSGSATTKGQTTRISGGLVLRGLDPATGALTWSRAVGQSEALSTGENVAFADATHFVVQKQNGRRMVLDTENGSLAPVTGAQVFWCEQDPLYKVNASSDGSVHGQRASAPVFTTCSASGTEVAARPSTEPAAVGVRVGGDFVWPSADGLHATRVPAAS
jgi:PQQ-like domain